jgi:RHS repeat-associated protein
MSRLRSQRHRRAGARSIFSTASGTWRRHRSQSAISQRRLWFEPLEPRLLLTNVSGHITTDTVWDNTAEPYVLVGNLYIDAGVTLTLAPEVLLRSNSYDRHVLVDGRLEGNGATIDLLYRFGSGISSMDVRAGGELVLVGGRLRGAGNTHVRSEARADLSGVDLAYHDGGTDRRGSPTLTYYSGSTGILNDVFGTATITISSGTVSVENGITVNQLTLNVPILVDSGTINELTTTVSATVTNSTIGFVNFNGGAPTLTGNTFTDGAPLRTTDPDNWNVADVVGNTYTAASPWAQVRGTLDGVREFPVIDGRVANYDLTGNITVASAATLTLGSGVLLRSNSYDRHVLVDGRLEGNGATIDLLYRFGSGISSMDVRAGGELVLVGGRLRGAGNTHVRSEARADLSGVDLAYHDGGTDRRGSPTLTYYSGSTGILNDVFGTATITISSGTVSVENGITVNQLTLNVPILVDSGTINELTTTVSATVTNSTIGFVNFNGGAPTLTGNTFTDGAPLRTTDPDNWNVADVVGNTYTAASPWAQVRGTLDGVREFPVIDGRVANYDLTGNITVASAATLTLGSGVRLRSNSYDRHVLVDGRLEGNGATIDLLYRFGSGISSMDVRAGGELVLVGGRLRGAGNTHVRSEARADLSGVDLAYHDGGTDRRGSPTLTYYSGSTGILNDVFGTATITISSGTVSVENGITVNQLTLNVPILVDSGTINELTTTVSATVTNSTIGFVNFNGGAPTLTGNTFTDGAPLRTTDPDNWNVADVVGNTYTAASPWAQVRGTLDGVREFPVIDGRVANYDLTGNITVASAATLTLGSGVLLRSNSYDRHVLVDGRLEGNGATIDLLYRFGSGISSMDVRAGGELVLVGGRLRGAGNTHVRSEARADLSGVDLAYHDGGTDRRGSPTLTYYSGSTGILNDVFGTATITISSGTVSVENGITVNQLTLNVPILVDSGTINELTTTVSATVTNSTIGFVNFNGGAPTLTGNTFTDGAPLRTTDPDNWNVADVVGNTYTAASPWAQVRGTLDGVREFPVIDGRVANYDLTGNITVASAATLTLGSGVRLRSNSYDRHVLVDGRLEGNGATIDLLYRFGSGISSMDVRAGGELVLVGGRLRGAGNTHVRSEARADLSGVDLAYHDGGTDRRGSPTLTYYSGSTGILNDVFGTATITISSGTVSVENGITVNQLTLNVPILVDSGTINELTTTVSATVTNSTIGFVNFNGGAPTLTGNTFTDGAPLRTTDPDNWNVADVVGNTYTAASPWAQVRGTLDGVREFPVIDGRVANYDLTGNITVASAATLTLGSGVRLRSNSYDRHVLVDGRLEGNGATIDLLYRFGSGISSMDVRAGGELVLVGGRLRGAGNTHVRSGARADLSGVDLAYHDGGTDRRGSPTLTYYAGSWGTIEEATGTASLVLNSNSVSVRHSTLSSITVSAAATITSSTIGHVNLNGGMPTFTANTFTDAIPFRTTDPDNLWIGRIFKNVYTSGAPQVNVSGTLNDQLALNMFDSVVRTYNLTGNFTVAAGAGLTVGPGATLIVSGNQQLDVSTLTTFINDGAIDLRVTGSSPARLRIGSDTTIDGRGEIRLNHNTLAKIEGPTDSRLTTGRNQTIRGYGEVSVDVINHGVLRAETSSRTLTLTKSLYNRGSMAARNGGTLHVVGGVTNSGVITANGAAGVMGTIDIDGVLHVTGGGAVYSPLVGGRILVAGDFLADTTNSDRFEFLGRVHLDGAGSEAAPLSLEAMGKDLGPVPQGFVKNFALYELRIDGTNFVQLIDLADNAAGDGSESVYVDRLIVAAGATLDLNGLNLYTRAAQIDGTVVGGTVAHVPDGGPIQINRITPGRIEVSGEVDEWTFFGWAGRIVRADLNAGTTGWYPNPAPQLTYGQLEIVDPSGTVIATDGTSVTLGEDGTYRLRVGAASSHPNATGHYTAVVWDTTPDVMPLRFNQVQAGRIDTPYSQDQWTFSAVAGTLVRFDLLEVNGQPLSFGLTGPDGWSGFQGLQADSGSITLPSSGQYMLTAKTEPWQYHVDYSFRFEVVQDDELILGVPYQGTIGGTGHSQFFQLVVSDPAMLSLTLDDESAVNRNELYFKLGAPPTRGDYDYRGSASGSPDQTLTVPMATAGTWYVLVYSAHAPTPSNYSLLADLVTVVVDSVTPSHHGTSADAVLTIRGAGFNRTSSVELVGSDGTSYSRDTISIDSSSQITASFAAGTVPAGDYDIRVTRTDGKSAVLFKAFEFVDGGQAKLETNLVLPSTLGYHQLATIYIEYTNTGDVAMPAPLLSFTVLQQIKEPLDPNVQSPLPPPPQTYWRRQVLSGGGSAAATRASGGPGTVVGGLPNPFPDYPSWLAYYRDYLETYYRQDAILTLDAGRVKDGFWTAAMPDGFSNSVSVLAHGQTPGLLQPGETGRIPVYWAGWLKPWDLTYRYDFEFSLVETTVDDTTPLDWDYWKDSTRPPSVSLEAWEPVWENFVSQAGTTWGEYVSMLARNAAYLGRLGQTTFDARDLLALEVMQSGGALPAGLLEQTVDAAMAAPGISLSFGRAFPSDVLHRNELGALGWGWSHSWEIHLEQAADGTVRIFDPGSSPRIFQPDVRGGYTRQPGDLGTLRALTGGRFSLTEISGTEYQFRADGLLDFVRDPHGNRISAGYLDGRLVTLVHTSGASLTLEYTPQGRLGRVTDSAGGATVYAYDAAGEHLLSVTSPRGVTTYDYAPDTTGPKVHALTKIFYPGDLQSFFSYDHFGRLERTWGSGCVACSEPANETTISYGPAGEVRVTQQHGSEQATTRLFFDHRRQIARVEDPLGRSMVVGYDGRGNTTTLELADGTQYSYQYDNRGNLRRQTDPLGQIGFTFTPAFNQLGSVTDARGNRIQYEYDAANGNLTAIRYEDGTFEAYTYWDNGTLKTWTNRLGQTVSYSREYYPDGRLQQVQRVLPDGQAFTYSYSYDTAGDWLVVTDQTGANAGAMRFNHHTGWLERVEYPGGYWLAYQYFDSGLRSQLMDQDGHITNYAYDATGRLDQLTDGAGTLIVDYDYDASGRLVREMLGNGVYTDYGYDLTSQVEQLVTRGPDNALIARFDYAYDDLGHRTSMATLDGIWTYDYDATGQLIRAVLASANPAIPNQDLEYVYDAAGNRIRTVTNGITTEYVTDSMNRYLQVDNKTYEYDLDGSLVRVHDGDNVTSYEYSVFNRLVKVQKSTDTWEYEYDAFGSRTATTHNGERTKYLIDPTGSGNVVGQYGVDGSMIARYSHGTHLTSRIDSRADVAFYGRDALGSVVLVTDDTAQVANTYAYDPFGNVLHNTETVTNPFQFVGGLGVMEEGNGMCYMRARFYSTELGRFISEDPIGLGGGDLNLYRYVGNSPTDEIDPTGLNPCVNFLIKQGTNLAAKRIGKNATFRSVLSGYNDAVFGHLNHPKPGQNRQILPWNPLPTCELPPSEDPPENLPTDSPPWEPPPITPMPPPSPDDPRHPRAPLDPNQKLGSGWGGPGYVTGDEALSYRIDFENDPAATAPAQFVLITDQLDSNFDWATFELTEIGFGDELISVPANSQYFETVVPHTYNDREFEVHISVRIDLDTGEIRAMFMSLDPDTGLPPDVMTGFLPPEDGTGRGQGYFSYTIYAVPDLPTGTEIRNIAEIQFDFGEIIATNQVDPHDPSQGTDPAKEALVTIDAGPPSSAVDPLPAVVPAGDLTVTWSGEDDAGGSGIKHYAVYVSTDGGPFELLIDRLTMTSMWFSAEAGHTYAFYTIATDNVGHRESVPSVPDALTYVNSPPSLAGLDINPNPVARASDLTLTATGATDVDGQVVRVEFYRDTNGDVVWDEDDELLGTASNPDDGWSLAVSTGNWPLGEHALFARVQDNDGDWSLSLSATIQVHAESEVVDFGVAPVFATRERAWTVHNAGTDLLVLQATDLALPFAVHPAVASDNGDDWIIAPGATKAFVLSYSPNEDGLHQTALRIIGSQDWRAVLISGWGASGWRNPVNPYDINGDGFLTAQDVLSLINEINRGGDGPVLPRTAEQPGLPLFLDPSGDGNLTPNDVLQVINFINRGQGEQQPSGHAGEGEPEGDRAHMTVNPWLAMLDGNGFLVPAITQAPSTVSGPKDDPRDDRLEAVADDLAYGTAHRRARGPLEPDDWQRRKAGIHQTENSGLPDWETLLNHPATDLADLDAYFATMG